MCVFNPNLIPQSTFSNLTEQDCLLIKDVFKFNLKKNHFSREDYSSKSAL